MEIEALAVTFIISLVLPIIVGVVTKASASVQLKQVVLIITTGVATLINTNLTDTGDAVLSWNTVAYWGIALIATIASYLGLYKPYDANDHLVPGAGLGSKPED
jgi:hypothetical protein